MQKFVVATHQSVREEADGIPSFLSHPPLRIDSEGEEEYATIPALFLVMLALDRVGIFDYFAERTRRY